MNLNLKRITFNNITMRELTRYDYIDYFEIGRDLETVRYLNWGPLNNLNESLYVFDEVFLKRPLDLLPVGYAIEIDSTMVGVIDFHTRNESENSIEIGYVLHRAYWGMGIMRKCLKRMIDVAFNQFHFDKVCIGSVIDNARSVRLIESVGFKYEYERIVTCNIGETIGVYYSIYKQEYEVKA